MSWWQRLWRTLSGQRSLRKVEVHAKLNEPPSARLQFSSQMGLPQNRSHDYNITLFTHVGDYHTVSQSVCKSAKHDSLPESVHNCKISTDYQWTQHWATWTLITLLQYQYLSFSHQLTCFPILRTSTLFLCLCCTLVVCECRDPSLKKFLAFGCSQKSMTRITWYFIKGHYFMICDKELWV